MIFEEKIIHTPMGDFNNTQITQWGYLKSVNFNKKRIIIMALEEGFDLFDELNKNEVVPGLDDVKEEKEDDGFNGDDVKFDFDSGIIIEKMPENGGPIKHYYKGKMIGDIELFTKNGKFANLNNLNTRTLIFNLVREDLIQHFVEICREDSRKQGKNQTNFATFECALRVLALHLDEDNHIIGIREGYNVKLNTKQLKRFLGTGNYALSKAQATALIRAAKKADIIHQKGRGDNAYFIMNPIFSNGAYIARISRKALVEFNSMLKPLFAEQQYIDCIKYLIDQGELSEDCFMENNNNEK